MDKTGVYVPLYVYPGGAGKSQWESIIKSKLDHPSVPFVVVINPSSGVGIKQDNNYVIGINKLKSAGIIVIGYVYTNYGSRKHYEIKSEIYNYKEWYDVDGIMFDEMSNRTGNEQYYEALSAYSKSLGMKLTKGNPGTSVPPSYTNTADNFVIYENSGFPNLQWIKDSHTEYDKNNLSFVSYGISQLDIQYINHAADCVGLMYITENVLPNPYDSIPSYFEDLVSVLDERK